MGRRVGQRALFTVLLTAACGVACGGDSGAAADAALPDAFASLCPVPEGRSYICTSWRFLPETEGFDLDGDEVIDNEAGKIPQSAFDSIHEGMDESIRIGELLLISLIADWTDPPTPSDADIGLHLFQGEDADIPPDPSNNYGGDGEFYLRLYEFDVACNSLTKADQAVLVDNVLSGTNSEWAMVLSDGAGAIRMLNVVFSATFDATFEHISGDFGAMATVCSLSQLGFPGETSGTMLDALVNDPVIKDHVSVDMDVDGDGLEQIVGDGATILECIDGDGTIVPGRECPCHPRIADAYSVAVRLQFTGARLIGVQ